MENFDPELAEMLTDIRPEVHKIISFTKNIQTDRFFR